MLILTIIENYHRFLVKSVIYEKYQLVPGNIEMFQGLLSKDSEATLTAYVTTTLGELYKSEPYHIKDIVKQRQYVR